MDKVINDKIDTKWILKGPEQEISYNREILLTLSRSRTSWCEFVKQMILDCITGKGILVDIGNGNE